VGDFQWASAAGSIVLLNERSTDLIRRLALMCSSPVGEKIDLVLTDPPWKFEQRFGASAAEDHYPCMEYDEIADDFEAIAPHARRVAMWMSNAHEGPFLHYAYGERGWAPHVTGGAWDKGPVKYGQGYHAAGRTEPWKLWTNPKGDAPFCDRKVLLETGCVERVTGHSMKPVRYQSMMVRKWVPPGGLVVDFYAGYATSAAAVKMAGEGRRFIGCELTTHRWRDACASLGLDETHEEAE
jgi:hypothetical protein